MNDQSKTGLETFVRVFVAYWLPFCSTPRSVKIGFHVSGGNENDQAVQKNSWPDVPACLQTNFKTRAETPSAASVPAQGWRFFFLTVLSSWKARDNGLD